MVSEENVCSSWRLLSCGISCGDAGMAVYLSGGRGQVWSWGGWEIG